MINKRLIAEVSESKKYVAGNVASQWISLLANIAMMASIARMMGALYDGTVTRRTITVTAVAMLVAMAVRFAATMVSSEMGFRASKAVKKKLRRMIYEKLLRLGPSYRDRVNTSEVVQVSVEGVEQLETYFGAYLPQFFYSMLAPLTLFIVLSFVNMKSALVLLLCVPMIPVTIVLIQRWAKKLLSRYWGQYAALGDTFLENLEGLTTTKIYEADAFKHREMNEESEHFRKITMKVLTMQLNSLTIMDLIAYGGAALGMIMATTEFRAGRVDFFGAVLILLLAADFFLPMRLLGSYFHVAMNGMAASEKFFHLLSLEEPEEKYALMPESVDIFCRNLDFSYDGSRKILDGVEMTFPMGSFTAIVGESGCGKSTLCGILAGRIRGYEGELTIGGVPLREIRESSLAQNVTYISHESYLFKGTVRENLLMARPDASDAELLAVLERVNLKDFLESGDGLDTMLLAEGANFSGGQRQRLALARALLHDSPIYLFDEATSNIDVESEEIVMHEVHELAKTKTVIVVSHRLANVVAADRIDVLADGKVQESGTQEELLAQNGVYATLWEAQRELEEYMERGERA